MTALPADQPAVAVLASWIEAAANTWRVPLERDDAVALAERLHAAGWRMVFPPVATSPDPQAPQEVEDDLTARLAAADVAWSHEVGDPPAAPEYIRWLARQVAAFAPNYLPKPQTDGAAMIAAQRRRQIDAEGYDESHDDQHTACELLDAAHCYANQGRTAFPEFTHRYGTDPGSMLDQGWPWWVDDQPEGWTPSGDPIADLTKAGALIAAEIDRLRRAAVGETDGLAETTDLASKRAQRTWKVAR